VLINMVCVCVCVFMYVCAVCARVCMHVCLRVCQIIVTFVCFWRTQMTTSSTWRMCCESVNVWRRIISVSALMPASHTCCVRMERRLDGMTCAMIRSPVSCTCFLIFLGRLFDRVDLMKLVSNVGTYMRTYVCPSTKNFLRFPWNLVCR